MVELKQPQNDKINKTTTTLQRRKERPNISSLACVCPPSPDPALATTARLGPSAATHSSRSRGRAGSLVGRGGGLVEFPRTVQFWRSAVSYWPPSVRWPPRGEARPHRNAHLPCSAPPSPGQFPLGRGTGLLSPSCHPTAYTSELDSLTTWLPSQITLRCAPAWKRERSEALNYVRAPYLALPRRGRRRSWVRMEGRGEADPYHRSAKSPLVQLGSQVSNICCATSPAAGNHVGSDAMPLNNAGDPIPRGRSTWELRAGMFEGTGRRWRRANKVTPSGSWHSSGGWLGGGDSNLSGAC